MNFQLCNLQLSVVIYSWFAVALKVALVFLFSCVLLFNAL